MHTANAQSFQYIIVPFRPRPLIKIYHSEFDTVYDACKEAIKDLDMIVRYSNRKQGVIKAETSFTLFSWGENIIVDVIEVSKNKTKVKIESMSKGQLIDWGINSSNEQELVDEITLRLNT